MSVYLQTVTTCQASLTARVGVAHGQEVDYNQFSGGEDPFSLSLTPAPFEPVLAGLFWAGELTEKGPNPGSRGQTVAMPI